MYNLSVHLVLKVHFLSGIEITPSLIWTKWYEDWTKLRFAIEQKIQPIIERGLKSIIPVYSNHDKTVAERLIAVLENYKNNIDKFLNSDIIAM